MTKRVALSHPLLDSLQMRNRFFTSGFFKNHGRSETRPYLFTVQNERLLRGPGWEAIEGGIVESQANEPALVNFGNVNFHLPIHVGLEDDM